MSKPTKKALQKAKADFEQLRKKQLDAVLWEKPSVARNLVDGFGPFCSFSSGDLNAKIFFTAPGHPSWTPELEKYIFDLTKANMESIYNSASGPRWRWNDAKKRGELYDTLTRYFVAAHAETGEPLGFLAFRLELEDAFEVLYVYELQTGASARRKGLGQRLMQLAELVSRKNGFQWVMLTVLRNNEPAIDFYSRKLKYKIDETSPSMSGEEAAHEIMSKAVHPKAIETKEAIAAAFAAGSIPAELLDNPLACARPPAAVPVPAPAPLAAAGGAGAAPATATASA